MKAFDYNGTIVAPSKPTAVLSTKKRTVIIDSADRDSTRYYTNGDIVVFLPRVYENVVSIRLMAGEFPPIISGTNSPSTPGALTHSYGTSSNLQTAYSTTGDVAVPLTTYYLLLDIEGLNKTDETTLSSIKSSFPDSTFAKIPVTLNNGGFIEYNDHSAQDNIVPFTPPIGKLDRLHIRTRLHSQQGNKGFVYWTTNGGIANGTNQLGAEYSLTLEIEYLDNSFDSFSSFETRRLT